MIVRTPTPTARAFQPKPGALYKLIYLAKRNPTLTAEEFPQAWREHSQLASSYGTSLGKHFLSSHQNVKDRAEDLDPSFANDYDGSTILGMKSWEDLLAARYHPHSLDELQEDEKRVFAGWVDDWTMAVEENVLVDGKPTGNVILSFLTPCDPADFAEKSLQAAQSLVALLPGASRIVWNRVVDPASAYPFAAVIEAWLPDATTAKIAASDSQIVPALEQSEIADPEQGARLLARLNLAKATSSTDGDTSWSEESA